MSKPLIENKNLLLLRKDLSVVDKKLLDLIFKRFDIVKAIFLIKKNNKIQYKDKNQEEQIWNTFWKSWENNNNYLTKADWPYFSKILTNLLDQSFLQAFKFISRKK